MKRFNLFYLILLLTLIPFFKSQAGVFKSVEEIVSLQDLPNTPAFINQNGDFVDLAFKYDQFRMFNIPIWNYGMTYCAVSESWYGRNKNFKFKSRNKSTDLVELTEEEAKNLTQKAGIDLPEMNQLGFYDRIGGKLIILAIIVVIIFLRSVLSKPSGE